MARQVQMRMLDWAVPVDSTIGRVTSTGRTTPEVVTRAKRRAGGLPE